MSSAATSRSTTSTAIGIAAAATTTTAAGTAGFAIFASTGLPPQARQRSDA
jgi:hypothetical protein